MITVLGASGFVGSHVVQHVRRLGLACHAIGREEVIPSGPLGHVIDCVGVTGDFRERTFDTVDAHVSRLLRFLDTCHFESFVYCSSTRVYGERAGTARETDPLVVRPSDPEDLYGISKVMGEALVHSLGEKGRVTRLSHVYGRGLRHSFLGEVFADLRSRGRVVLRTAESSARDFISIDDVATLLTSIAMSGSQRVYNVASGVPVTNGALGDALRALGFSVEFEAAARLAVTPEIDISRVRDEFGFAPRPLLDELALLLEGNA